MQPGIFGSYPRYSKDMGCPSDAIPAGTLLSDIDFAVRYPPSSTQVSTRHRAGELTNSTPLELNNG